MLKKKMIDVLSDKGRNGHTEKMTDIQIRKNGISDSERKEQ
jgi:hypothetical protein